MRILVTGGAGFIASHVAEAFRAAGHEVLAVDDLSTGKMKNLPPDIPLEVIDIRDREALNKVFADFKPQVINHHAAQISVRDSVEDPVRDADLNIIASLKLLETARASNVQYFMFASTGGAIYGEQDYFPADEDHPERPLSPYGVAKLAVERYLFFYEKTYGLPWCALRYSNVYGPRQDPHGEAGVVAIFARKMLKGEQPLINGDGEQTRDYVFVGDVARANLLALEKRAVGPINIATGKETTVNQIFHMIKKLSAAQVEEKHGPPKPGEQRRSVLNPSRAARLLGWKPEVSLEEGLKKTVEFFRHED